MEEMRYATSPTEDLIEGMQNLISSGDTQPMISSLIKYFVVSSTIATRTETDKIGLGILTKMLSFPIGQVQFHSLVRFDRF